MALGDAQIISSAVEDGNSDYVIPASASIQLKAVQALFEDNGAGGDWLPAVVAISDSGHVLWRAVDQAVKVTAGDDAEVSWFPGVKHSQAAAATTPVPLAQAYFSFVDLGDPFQVIGVGGDLVSFAHTYTNDPSVYTFTTITNPNDTIVLHSSKHIYSVYYGNQWNNSGFVQWPFIGTGSYFVAGSGELFGAQYFPAIAPFAATDFKILTPSGGVGNVAEASVLLRPQNLPFNLRMRAQQDSGISQNLNAAWVMILAHQVDA